MAFSSDVLVSIAALSTVSCAGVVVSISRDSKAKKSYQLQLVQRLLFSNLILSTLFISFYAVESYLTISSLKVACYTFLPLVIIFFIASYSWTVLLALRFRRSYSRNKTRVASTGISPIPFWMVWMFAIVLAIPTFVTSLAGLPATTIGSDDDAASHTCSFNHITVVGVAMDVITFQAPLIITVILSIYLYIRGLYSLHDAPFSVLSRRLRRAGGYLFVLIVVWVPNLVYNALCMFDKTNTGFAVLEAIVVNLASAQGFLNVCVYVWSQQKMRSWFYENMAVRRAVRSILRYINNDPSPPDNDTVAAEAGPGEDDSRSKTEEDDDDDDIINDGTVEEDGASRFSFNFSQSLFRSSLLFPNSKDNVSITIGTNGTSTPNPLAQGAGSVTDGNTSSASTSISSAVGQGLRSILVDPSKAEWKNKQKYASDTESLDAEKFVRFGKTDVTVLPPDRSSVASFDSTRWSEGSESERDLELSRFKPQQSLASTAKEKWRKIIADVGLGKPSKQSPLEDNLID